MAERAGDARLQARIEVRLASLYAARGSFAEARRHCGSALRIANEWQLDRIEVLAALNLGAIAHEERDLDGAQTAHQQAIAIAHSAGLAFLEGMAGVYLGMAYHASDRLLDAAGAYERTLRVLRDLGFVPFTAIATAALGAVRATRGETELATEAFDTAEALLKGVDDAVLRGAVDVLRSHLDLALAQDALGRQDDAAAQALLSSATERAARVRAASPGDGSIASRSELVRIALTLPKPALGALGSGAIVVATDGSWFKPPNGQRVELARNPVSRRLLLELVERRLESPGSPLSRDDLVGVGWPNEVLTRQVARSRLHMAMSALRKLGLRDVLKSPGTGWFLDASVPIVRVDPK